MSASERSSSLTHYARLGFSRLGEAELLLAELESEAGFAREDLLSGAAAAADPDEALGGLARIARRDADAVRAIHGDPQGWRALWALLGASTGFADFYLRHPEELPHLAGAGVALPGGDELRTSLLESVGATEGFAADGGEASWVALRVRYRRLLARIAAYDLLSASPSTRWPPSPHDSPMSPAQPSRHPSASPARASRTDPRQPGSSRVNRWRPPSSPSSAWARPARASSTTSATST